MKKLGVTIIPTMPDGNIAYLPIDPSAGNEHQLNAHGWSPNNIQEYANTENESIKSMLMKNLEIQAKAMDPNSSLSDVQKAALCGSRYAQTVSEFINESLRIDAIRNGFEVKENPSSPVPKDSENTIKFEEEIKD